MRKKRRLILFACAALLALVLIRWFWPQPDPMYTVTILPSLGGDFTLPCAINDSGQVVGYSEVAKGVCHLFLWERDKGMQDLGPVNNNLLDINNAGQIVGMVNDPNGRERAFVWDPREGRRMLPALGKNETRVHAINNLGQVVGAADTEAGVLHAFVWDPAAGMRDLTPSSTTQTRAWSINDAGQVIVFTSGGPVLMHVNGDPAATSRPIPARGLMKVNNGGDIAGAVPGSPRRYDVIAWREDTGTRRLFQLEADTVYTPQMNDVGQVVVSWAIESRSTVLGLSLFQASWKSSLWDPKRGHTPLDRYVSVGRREQRGLS